MRRLLTLVITLALTCPLSAQTTPSPVASVNVFTGTSNSQWMLFPGAAVPMGMVKFSPVNQGNAWNGGYEYTIANIAGFSFLHTLGLSSFSMMPVTGNKEGEPGHFKVFPGSSDGPLRSAPATGATALAPTIMHSVATPTARGSNRMTSFISAREGRGAGRDSWTRRRHCALC